jgi:creatinine amidohydrolase
MSVALTNGQFLSAKWEELTAEDFTKAIGQSRGVCVLPFGIIEEHGPHLPLRPDLINVRYAVLHGVEQQYAVIFPEYYFGQIFEVKHEPGTVAYSAPDCNSELLQETTDEVARNGCRKILIANGHGGNNNLLPFFAQSQMASPHDYVVYIFQRGDYPPRPPPLKTKVDAHAGES